MHIFRGLPRAAFARPCALTIGNFDGVHLGHQAMLRELKRQAEARGLATCVVTFDPHPKEFFATASAPLRISTLRDKLAALESCGVDSVVILPFNDKLASLSPEAFVSDILVHALQTKLLLIGDDFCFGAKRAGNFALLEKLAPQMGYQLQAMPSIKLKGIRVSSSAVRHALVHGQMSNVQALLGRPYTISGHIIHGAKLGRTLGTPTLNVAFKHQHPALSGIFVVRVMGLTKEPLEGVANLGTRPALDPTDVNGGRVLLETYCFDWPALLGKEGGYGKIICVELLHKLHDELAYDGLKSLKAGIANDIALAKKYLLQT